MGLLTAPAAGSSCRLAKGLPGHSLWGRAAESVEVATGSPHGPRGRNVMGPEVGMGMIEGLPLLPFTPGPGALHLRDLEPRELCAPEVRHKMRLCTDLFR